MNLRKRLSKLEMALRPRDVTGPYPKTWVEPTEDEVRRFLAGEDVPAVPIDRGAWLNFLAHLEKQDRRRAAAEAADHGASTDHVMGPPD
jgi:hypothetical protein